MYVFSAVLIVFKVSEYYTPPVIYLKYDVVYMSVEPDQWAKDWLAEQRSRGRTGLTVEKRGNSHIVRWATTWWDSVAKKRHKESVYCGVLSEDGTIVERRIDHERRTRYCAYVIDLMRSMDVQIEDKPIMWRFLKSHPGVEHEFKRIHRMAQEELPGCTEKIAVVPESEEHYVRYSILIEQMTMEQAWKVVEINRRVKEKDIVVNSI